tara:strand:- start:24 stop:311 length:288 start_codon:yes stop_codon:yes gene_type:complete
MQIKKATLGEINLYAKIKDGEVRAIRGKSDKGDGWRPVCRGRYLGSACLTTESAAITNGKIFIAELKKRVEGVQAKSISKPAAQKRTRKPKAVSK